MPVTIKYWNLRGLAEAIRLMLEYLDVEYETKPLGSGEQWVAEKYNMGVDYPNLPMYDDGEVKLTQSFAIWRYIARKYKVLAPETEEQMRMADVAEGALTDLRYDWGMFSYSPQTESAKQAYLADLPAKLRGFETVLDKREWLAGKLTYVDFAVCEKLAQIATLWPQCFDKTPNVRRYLEKFEALPRIKAYRESNRFQKLPINGPQAWWGGTA